MKAAFPYKEITGAEFIAFGCIAFGRKLFGESAIPNVGQQFKAKNKWYSTRGKIQDFDTKEEAMAELDRALIEEGYSLIPEDEVDRYEKKLALLI